MKSSDLIITKPGGLTTTESLLSHLPMIIPFIIPVKKVKIENFYLKVIVQLLSTTWKN